MRQHASPTGSMSQVTRVVPSRAECPPSARTTSGPVAAAGRFPGFRRPAAVPARRHMPAGRRARRPVGLDPLAATLAAAAWLGLAVGSVSARLSLPLSQPYTGRPCGCRWCCQRAHGPGSVQPRFDVRLRQCGTIQQCRWSPKTCGQPDEHGSYLGTRVVRITLGHRVPGRVPGQTGWMADGWLTRN